MTQQININGLQCSCCVTENARAAAYILYPMDVLASWIEPAAQKYGISIIVITGMDWDNVFSPWPAPGEPPGSPDFQGKSQAFLQELQQNVIPTLEAQLQLSPQSERTLFGVSMSGLFALWQWMVSDTFTNIASLSGSFWYPGFIDWFKKLTIPKKTGKAYFLLGTQEPDSPVPAFRPVGINTREIVQTLKAVGIATTFQSVPGNHFSDPIPRLNKALAAIYTPR